MVNQVLKKLLERMIGLHGAYSKATNQNVGLNFGSDDTADVATFKDLSYERWPPHVRIPDRIHIPRDPRLEGFAICLGIPGPEAGGCMTALAGCAATTVAYGLCVGAICGAGGAAHTYRCANEFGYGHANHE